MLIKAPEFVALRSLESVPLCTDTITLCSDKTESSAYLYYISQWQLITPSNGQKHYKTAEKRPILRITCRLQMVSEIRDF